MCRGRRRAWRQTFRQHSHTPEGWSPAAQRGSREGLPHERRWHAWRAVAIRDVSSQETDGSGCIVGAVGCFAVAASTTAPPSTATTPSFPAGCCLLLAGGLHLPLRYSCYPLVYPTPPPLAEGIESADYARPSYDCADQSRHPALFTPVFNINASLPDAQSMTTARASCSSTRAARAQPARNLRRILNNSNPM